MCLILEVLALQDIREYTNGRGVDMILNSLTGEGFIDASLSILDI